MKVLVKEEFLKYDAQFLKNKKSYIAVAFLFSAFYLIPEGNAQYFLASLGMLHIVGKKWAHS